MSSSCELNETGEKVNPDCEQQALILLDPSNRLLPGNISMIHEIKEINQSTNETTKITLVNFYVNFAPDIHEVDENLPTGNSEEEIIEISAKEQILELIIFISLLCAFFVGIELIKSNRD
jgi:hypothetical protein